MDVVSYKCPNCGAPMVFSIETQQWDCHFCSSSFSKEELDKFNENIGRETPELASWDVEVFGETDLVGYSCPNCGGRVMTEENTVATFCPYCHNPTVIASRLSGEYKPARILPFQIPKKDVLESLRKLIRGKPLLPKSFREYIEKGEITGLYVPFWLFSADMNASMTAEGHRITSWSDSKYIYTKTDVFSIQRKATVPFRHIPVDASRRLDDRLMDSIEPYDYGQLTSFSMEYLSGHFAESFDVDAQLSRDRFVKRANQAVEQVLRGSARGFQSVRILNLTANPIGLDNLYTMLPVWTISVQYGDEVYAFAMNGQTGKAAGNLPISGKRSLAVFGGIFGLGLLITVIVSLLLRGGII